ncbi:AAA domain-containing protein [Solwaraspora sp. WMMA2056]|uniref:serine/threonine-protein kinase n=1 Tax=Solwaraspora sp. WMMA2056 TaxID=3015161 RepID=UPI00259B2CF8|nr:serine/threonine-protein kinase [Solwaraspora sp. WMMA2056]WJK40487.1 AAA domain-containing protein [Solwaraspora sp. WMMA2056]
MPPTLVNGRFVLTDESPKRGGLSEVRKAFDSASGGFVAVKMLNSPTGDGVIEIFLQRETETLGKLQHKNIVRLLDSGWSAELGKYFMALEWIDRSLKDELDAGRVYEWQEYFDKIGLPLANALSFAHAKEIEHRDVKPGNVLLDPEGEVKLADFGIAKIRSKMTDPDRTVSGFRSGLYAPPEMDDSVPYVRDIFAFGVLAVKVLASREVASYADLEPALNSLVVVPNEIRDVLWNCVALDRSDRFKNAAVLNQKLTDAYQIFRQRTSRKNNVLWLGMTRAAAGAILRVEKEKVDQRRAEADVLNDLGDVLHIDYGYDARSRQVDRDVIVLAGKSMMLRVVQDHEYDDRARIVSASVRDEEWLRRWREKAVDFSRLLTLRFDDPGEAAASAGIDFVLDRLDEDQSNKRAAAESSAENGDKIGDLYEKWRRLLEAREVLARGARKPIVYRGITQRGRKIIFHLTEPHEISLMGEEWEVAHSPQGYSVDRGEVIEQTDDGIRIQFRKQTNRVPRNGVLVPYLGPSKVALQRQQEALVNVRTGQTANPRLGQIIQDPISLQAGTPVEVTEWSRGNLDQSKQQVVRHALGTQDLLLIQGPPGTGKTTVIVEIVRQTIRRQPNARILIVSQTHIAVDNALERLESAGVEGLVRLGRPDDPRVSGDVRHLLIDGRIKKWSRGIRAKAAAYLKQIASAQGLNSRHLEAALLLEELAAIQSDASHVREVVARLESSITGDKTSATRNAAGDLINARERLERLQEKSDELMVDIQVLLDGALTLPARPNASVARSAIGALLGDAPTAHNLMNLLRLQGEWLQRIDTDMKLVTAYLRTTNVVGGTALGFLSHPAARELDFDLCIFDEASKATATEALVPLARARQWILVGDTNQLPPMDEDLLREPRLIDEFGLTEELIKTTLFQYLSDRTAAPIRHMLTEQYRMTPAIGNLVSTCFYQGELVSPNRHLLKGYDRLNKPVLWINTRSLGEARRESIRSFGNTSVANPAEASQVIAALEVMNRAVDLHMVEPGGDRLNILVIAPYGRQVEDLRRRVAGMRPTHLIVEVLSVDAVQGRECDIAIFSVTRSNERGEFGFIGEHYWRRINVALSRARFGLIVIGDAEFCRGKPGALRDVLYYISEHPEECGIRDAGN